MESKGSKINRKPECIGLGVFVDAVRLGWVAEAGDLIEIDHTLYSDWALFDGRGYVIVVTGSEPGEDIPAAETAVVKRLPLTKIQGPARVNNRSARAKERGLCPLPPECALDNARAMLDTQVTFNLLTRNAEHYTTEWKYGTAWSDQATMAIGVMRSLSREHAHRDLRHTLTSVLHSPKTRPRQNAQK